MSKLVKCEESKQKIVTQCQSFKKLLKLSKCAGKKKQKKADKKVHPNKCKKYTKSAKMSYLQLKKRPKKD